MEQNNSISWEQAVESEPLILSPDSSLKVVIDLMSRNWTNSCLVSDKERDCKTETHTTMVHGCVLAIADGQLQGILTEQTLVHFISSGKNLQGMKLAEVMNRDVITLASIKSPDAIAILKLFRKYQIQHLPIVNEHRHFLGLVTHASLRRVLRSTDLLKLHSVRDVMSRAIHASTSSLAIEVTQLMSDYRVSCIPIVKIEAERLFPVGIITERDIVKYQLLELNLARVWARDLMSTPLIQAKPEDSLWEVYQRMNRHCLQRLVVVGQEGELLGIVSQSDLLRALDSTQVQSSLQMSSNSQSQWARAKIEVLERRNLKFKNRLKRQAEELQALRQRERTIGDIALKIGQSLHLDSILQTTVTEIRQSLAVDRALIYRLEPNGDGIVSTEAVSDPRWSIIERVVKDSCFERDWITPYQQGHIFAVADVERANLSFCHLEFLKSFQVKANVAVPILLTDSDTASTRLWGLLIVHQCSAPRTWKESELKLLQLLVTQAAIAIRHGELYQQARIELKQRRQIESALKESEARFKDIANTAPVMIWMSVTDKSCTFFNRTWLEFTGRTLEQESGNGWAAGVHPNDRQRCWQVYSAAFDARQVFTMEYRLRRADGEYRWILHCGVPRYSGNNEFIGYIGSCIDISDRQAMLLEYQRTEEMLQEREAQLRTALDAAVMGTWSWELSTEQVILSRRSQSILGFSHPELSRTFPLDEVLQRIHPEDRHQIERQTKKAIEFGEFYEVETRIVTSQGKPRWLMARGHVLFDANREPNRMIGVIADITEKKRLAEQSSRHQRLENLGSLAGGIAHDLNNILTPIMMSVQLLPIILPQVDSRSRELIQMLENNIKRGSALVQQVLSFAKGIEGQLSIVQVKHLLREIEQIALETFPKSIQIQTNIASNLLTVKADATQIHQILLNLVINSRDAMPEGGVLDISAVNLSVDAEYVREHPQARVGSYVAITIADTGTGIASDSLEQIFEPFFTTKAADGGTGLGLATVKNIVEGYGGFIDVVSQVGRGTQFNVLIPATEVPEPEFPENNTIPKGAGELILVVDDEATIREITKASLEAHNYRVVTAKNGIEAIASYVRERDSVAVVLMNMSMPTMDGKTAILTLQEIDPDIKIIAVSGRNIADRSSSLPLVDSFLSKPYTTQALLQKIKEVVSS